MKQLLKDRKRVVAMALVAVFLLAVSTYAMTVDNFTDYKPPDYLYLRYGDVAGGIVEDYPYRAVFYGRVGESVSGERMFAVYSKKPVTDLFTFQYMGNDKTGKSGRIRAFINRYKVNQIDTNNPDNNSDVLILGSFANGPDSQTPVIVSNQPYPNFTVAVSSHGTQGMDYYFNFDFFYDCASEHANGYVDDLRIDGLTSISGVPYKYIIHCVEHTGYTGGGSSGGSSSSGSGGLSGDKNTGGNGGKHGWGTGDYGGGVNKDDIVSGNDGGGYTSRPDMDISIPDDWKKPVEDNYNSMPDSEYKPDYPEYIPAEGDTGQTGENWELPKFSEDDGVSGEIQGYKELKPEGEQGLIDFMSPMEDWIK